METKTILLFVVIIAILAFCVYLLSNVGEFIRGFEDGFNAAKNK
ncbi:MULTISPECIES: hypothetical protein [Sphingobacterium]|jgi:hypothetical protein|nr:MULTISPECIES: hypothetical protein [Sphingobacterium]